MANIKSAKKRIKVTEKKTLQNKMVKSALKTAIKKVLAEVEAGNKDEAVKAYNEVASKLDASVVKGIHHRNYASRQKSRLAKLVNSI